MSLVEIEFKGRRKGVYLNPQELSLKRSDLVIVSADRGEDLGRVSLAGEQWQETLTRIHRLLGGRDSGNGNGNGRHGADDNGNGGHENEAQVDAAVEATETTETPPAPASDAASDSQPETDSATEPSGENTAETQTPAAISEEPAIDLPEILRMAGERDIEQDRKNRDAEREARQFFYKEVRRLDLEMKLVDIEYQLDRKKLTFYFTSDGRVDFRELVKTLAQNFHTRIDLRQIGARDEAKRLGGIGLCGRVLCCATWIREFKPVTTSMLKEQGLLMNPQKNTGLCGKLRCCIRYEVDQYREVNRLFPKEGMRVQGPRGGGLVEKVSMCHSSLGVKWEDGQRIGYSFDQVRKFTNWDSEKRDEIKEIQFLEDPSIIVQVKEEREGRLVTTFSYEEKSDTGEKRRGRNKIRRSSRAERANRSRGNNDENGAKGAATPGQDGPETQSPEQERGKKRLFRGRRGGRGRRDRSDQQQGSDAQGQAETSPRENKREPETEERSGRHRGGHRSKGRKSGRNRSGKEGAANQARNEKKSSDNRKNADAGRAPGSSTGDGPNTKPKGQPIHRRGHRRRR